MNRASMLRLVACGIIGLGAALLIAALLLSTYTAGKTRKMPPMTRSDATDAAQAARIIANRGRRRGSAALACGITCLP